MSFNKLLFISSIFIYILLQTPIIKTSQVKIIPPENNQENIFLLGDDDIITKDQNCNSTEYPENAQKCDLNNMVCEDPIYLHKCRCKDGYITFPTTNVTKYCNKKTKKQVYAFWLEFICGFGAGHFYRNAYTVASLKLVAFLFGLIFLCAFPILAKCISEFCDCECLAFIVAVLTYLYMTFLAVWYIYDLVNFGKNNYKDYTYYPILLDLEKW